MTRTSVILPCLLLGLIGLGAGGCSVLKPQGFTPRTFVLTPAPATNPPPAQVQLASRGIGLGYVKLPAYLIGRTMAIRKGPHEIAYLENAVWGERLDHALQRVLAANLAALMPSCQVRLSAWRTDDVTDEVYVTIERFDVDANGTGTLNAWWRVVPPGGGPARSSGHFQQHSSGPAPGAHPDGAVASLSALAAELSRTIAQALDAGHLPAPGSEQ
jgi:uncharacterized lipoprotein YmbA